MGFGKQVDTEKIKKEILEDLGKRFEALTNSILEKIEFLKNTKQDKS